LSASEKKSRSAAIREIVMSGVGAILRLRHVAVDGS
jgi:hypothetical protein